MDDLVQFLRDRLNDDETFMRAAIRLRDSGSITASPASTEGAFALMDVVANDPDAAEALTIFTRTGTRAPGEAERVLAEVEAKRRLLGMHASRPRGDGCVICDDGNDSCGCLSGPSWGYPCDTVKVLALPYADHPDYRDEWRP